MDIEVIIERLPSNNTVAMGPNIKPKDSKILGMTLEELDAKQREKPSLKEGGLVVKSIADGDAKKAGIQKGDILIMLDNQRFETLEQFEEIVSELSKERFVPLLVMRNSENPLFIALKLSD